MPLPIHHDELIRSRNFIGDTWRDAADGAVFDVVDPADLSLITRVADSGAADARAAKDAGSVFGVSPGYTAEIGAACRRLGLPLLPGVATASEVMAANADGLGFLKFFPATAAGGAPMLKALAGPFPDVVFCPTGGITAETAPQFLALSNVKVCGGSWLTPADAVAAGDWGRITALARATAALRAPAAPAR